MKNTKTQDVEQGFYNIADEKRYSVDTAQCAIYLNRKPQTLRGWACHKDGPLQPTSVHGRLAWRVADIRRCLGLPE